MRFAPIEFYTISSVNPSVVVPGCASDASSVPAYNIDRNLDPDALHIAPQWFRERIYDGSTHTGTP